MDNINDSSLNPMSYQNVVAEYTNVDSARYAVQALVDGGIDRNNISFVIADDKSEYNQYINRDNFDDVTGGEGAAFGALVGLLTGVAVSIGALLIPGIGPVIAAGPLIAGLAGGATGAAAGAVTGGITAALVKTGITEEEAQSYAENLKQGHALVSVRAHPNLAAQVEEILDRYYSAPDAAGDTSTAPRRSRSYTYSE